VEYSLRMGNSSGPKLHNFVRHVQVKLPRVHVLFAFARPGLDRPRRRSPLAKPKAIRSRANRTSPKSSRRQVIPTDNHIRSMLDPVIPRICNPRSTRRSRNCSARAQKSKTRWTIEKWSRKGLELLL
jgi:hypothetical protein